MSYDVAVPDKHRCPVDGKRVQGFMDCPGTHGKRRVVEVCSPPCGEATRYQCLGFSCPWWYRHPQGVRPDKKNMGIKPDWIEEGAGGQ